MASPMSATGLEGGHQKKPVSFQFCAECSNMLYPKEDDETRTLQFTCRTCHYTTAAANTCVFRNEMNNAASLHAGIIEGMGKDPTVGAASASSSAVPADSDTVLVLCMTCGVPITCPICKVRPCCAPAEEVDSQLQDDRTETSLISPPESECSSPSHAYNFSHFDESDIYDFLDDGDDAASDDFDITELSKSIVMTDAPSRS